MSYSSERRATLKAEGYCINGRHHGKATHGNRCPSCRAWHRGFKSIAIQLRIFWAGRGITNNAPQPSVVIPNGVLRLEREKNGRYMRRMGPPTATVADSIIMTEEWLDADRRDEMQALSDLTMMRKIG